MSFNTRELSRFLGKPIRLFRFQRQGAIWWFANFPRDVEAGSATWTGAQIERDDIKQTSEKAKDKLKIRMGYLRDPNAPPLDIPATQSLGDLWHPYIPSDPVSVMCFEHHYGDDDAPKLQWSGEVAQPEYTDVQLELTCVPGKAIAEARNQGAKFQRACWKEPYSTGLRGCNLDPDDFDIAGTLTAVAGLTVTAAAFATAPLSLLQGAFRWQRTISAHNGDVAITESRTIVQHSGSSVRLLYGGAGLVNGLEVVGRPSCPGNWAACEARDNTINYGGAIYKPVKSPLDGVSMSWG